MTRIRMQGTGRGLAAVKALENGEDTKHLEEPADKPSICFNCQNAVIGELAAQPGVRIAICGLVHQRLQFLSCSHFVKVEAPSPA